MSDERREALVREAFAAHADAVAAAAWLSGYDRQQATKRFMGDARVRYALRAPAETERGTVDRELVAWPEHEFAPASTVSALEAEVARFKNAAATHWARLERAGAEVAQLREALERIANEYKPNPLDCEYCDIQSDTHFGACPYSIARRALEARDG